MAATPLIESVNCAVWVLEICVVVLLGRYLVVEAYWIIQRYKETGQFEHMNRTSAANAIFVMALGDGTRRIWTWAGAYLELSDQDSKWLSAWPYSIAPVLGSIITMVGMLCMVRVFTPDEWGHRTWLACAGIAGASALAAALIRLGA